jgi:hypothetical protein
MQRKMDMWFGIWNVTSLYRGGSLETVTSELAKCKLDLVEVKRSDWTRVAMSQ